MIRITLFITAVLCVSSTAMGQPLEIPANAADPVNSFIQSLPWSETTAFWIMFLIAAVRGLAATTAEWIPNAKLGPLASVVDFLGGNQRHASGSQ